MWIERDLKEQIKDRVAPEMAIEYYTGQRSDRKKYLCPFHGDRHPSLTVKGDHWRCWSCGESGDVISFVMKYHSIGFQQALVRINEDFSLSLDTAKEMPRDQIGSIWDNIEKECRERNRREVRAYNRKLEKEIDQLTTAHRILYKWGAPEELVEIYSERLDDLLERRGCF